MVSRENKNNGGGAQTLYNFRVFLKVAYFNLMWGGTNRART